MKIEGTPKEIADFVNAIQGQSTELVINVQEIASDEKSIKKLLEEAEFYRKAKGGF